jgi:GH25 family lysozyme M1 (1,4-beta-N-acetylmuramidase)
MASVVLASCAFAAACSSGEGTLGSGGSSLADPDANVDADAGWPRLCPSTRAPDGGWITVDGIDVSDWQYTQWDEVTLSQPNLGFALARVSSGTVRVDTRFGHDWAEMKRLGLVRGAYQYFTPRFSAVTQADLFVRRLTEEGGLAAGDLPPVLDVETTNGMPDMTVTCRIKIWVSRVERALRRIPMIYTSYLWSAYFASDFRRYPLWVTNFVGTPSITCPRMPTAWDKWELWQHSASGSVPGVYNNGSRDDDAGSIQLVDGGDAGVLADTDLDFFDGTMDGLRAFIASTASSGLVDDPPPLVDPPHVSSTQLGQELDCSDGCCVADP